MNSLMNHRFWHSMSCLGILMCGLLSASSLRAQVFEAVTEAPEVVAGSTFEVSFNLNDAEGRSFRPPSLNGFKVVFGPSQTRSMTIINGKSSTKQGWAYQLEALKAGNYQIGEASVTTTDGKILKTKPLNIRVVAPRHSSTAAPPKGQDADLFVAAELDRPFAYIGQQITWRLKVYTLVSISGLDVLQLPDFEGFVSKEKRRFDTQVNTQIIKGKKYSVKTIDEIALFPKKEGEILINPANVSVTTGGGMSIFQAPILLQSLPLSIVVKPLPEPTPPHFSTSVGQFSWEVKHDHDTLDTDGALTMSINVHGNSEMRRFTAPQWPVHEGLEVFEPKMSKEEEYENGVELVFDKTIEYVILPKVPGNYALLPQMSYFDPDSNRYLTLKAPDSIRITVLPGANYHALSNGADSLDTPLVDTQQPGIFSNFWSKFGPSLLFLLLGGATLGVFFFIYRKRQKDLSLQTSIGNKVNANRDKLESSQIKVIHQIKQHSTAAQVISEPSTAELEKQENKTLERFNNAQAQMQLGNARAFYDEVYHLLIAIAAQRYGLNPAQISPSAVRMKIHDARNDAFIMAWQTCEEALFAHQDRQSLMEDTLRQVAFLLK